MCVAQLPPDPLDLVLLRSMLQFNKKLQKSSEFSVLCIYGSLFFIRVYGLRQGEGAEGHHEKMSLLDPGWQPAPLLIRMMCTFPWSNVFLLVSSPIKFAQTSG